MIDCAWTTAHLETIHFDVLRLTRGSALGPGEIVVQERVLDDYLRVTLQGRAKSFNPCMVGNPETTPAPCGFPFDVGGHLGPKSGLF